MLTAVLGAVVFSEELPGKSHHLPELLSGLLSGIAGLWWLGAAMLVAGSVIIGRREEGKDVGSAGTAGSEPAVFRDEADTPLTGAEGVSSDSEVSRGTESIELRRKTRGRAS